MQKKKCISNQYMLLCAATPFAGIGPICTSVSRLIPIQMLEREFHYPRSFFTKWNAFLRTKQHSEKVPLATRLIVISQISFQMFQIVSLEQNSHWLEANSHSMNTGLWVSAAAVKSSSDLTLPFFRPCKGNRHSFGLSKVVRCIGRLPSLSSTLKQRKSKELVELANTELELQINELEQENIKFSERISGKPNQGTWWARV